MTRMYGLYQEWLKNNENINEEEKRIRRKAIELEVLQRAGMNSKNLEAYETYLNGDKDWISKKVVEYAVELLSDWELQQKRQADLYASKGESTLPVAIGDCYYQVSYVEEAPDGTERKIQLINEDGELYTFYYYLAARGWRPSSFFGTQTEQPWKRQLATVHLPVHPSVQRYFKSF